jgi:TPR repeat protein
MELFRHLLKSMPKMVHGLTICVIIVLAFLQAHAASGPSADEIPADPFDDTFLTNWLASVRMALPAEYSTNGNLSFREETNDLCLESAKGNLAAQALWGFALIVLAKSPETSDAGLSLLHDSADKGYVPAMLNLGFLLEGGQYLGLDYGGAMRWFSRAADAGNAEAQLELSGCYFYGLGTERDYSKAAKYVELSAAQTNYAAMKSLGYFLMNGYGMEKNEDQAQSWLLRAAKEGHNRRAMYDLGVLYLEKFPDTNAMLESFQWMKQSAELGDALGAYELSNFYFNGWGGVPASLPLYHYWQSRAAQLGATDAQFFLGQSYRIAEGANSRKSLLWLDKAADKNHPEALYDLALYYFQDRTNHASVEAANDLMVRAARMGHREAQFQCALSCFRGDLALDCDGGNKWITMAATNGWPKAEFMLFQLYYNGLAPSKDCPRYSQDKVEAVKWLRRAAEHGSLQAQSTLAVMLIRGLDVEPDKVEAEKLLRDAAEHGYAQAQNDLGFAILNGDISSTDPLEAAVWCDLAHAHASDPNTSNRSNYNFEKALSQLSPDQQQEADKRVQSFRPLPVPQMEPKIKDWDKNPDYRQEDGRFGH